MPKRFRRREEEGHDGALEKMFQTRSHAWESVGLARQLSMQAARRARREVVVILPLLAGVIVLYYHRKQVFGAGLDMPVRIGTVIALLALGWAFARSMGSAFGPSLFRRMDPATAGTLGFLIRLTTIIVVLLLALRIAGLTPQTIAVGGAFTAVIFGLAAQQTLGNVIAGTVLLSARPFRVGERIRLQAGGVAGNVEGVVSSLGLLYLTLSAGEDRIMVPNSVALNAAVTPLREPNSVDLTARLPSGTRPSRLQEALAKELTVVTRSAPDIELVEIDGDEVVLRIGATPQRSADGPKLADQVSAAVSRLAADAEPLPTPPHGVEEGDGTEPGRSGAEGVGPSERAGERTADDPTTATNGKATGSDRTRPGGAGQRPTQRFER
ncbi:MAG TPA: mechanosensitive ion channel family protein [Solirubrobacteraceae bacterium]